MFTDVEEVIQSLESVRQQFDLHRFDYYADVELLENRCIQLCHLGSFIPGCFDVARVLAQAISASRIHSDHAAERDLLRSITMLRGIERQRERSNDAVI